MSELLIVWNEELETGIDSIDEQHQQLVDILNEFYAATQQHEGPEVGAAILERLGEYTRVHFTVEESVMRLLDYPDYDAHKALHDELLETFRSLAAKYASGKRSANFELIHFLKLWLVKHIQKSDMEYTHFYRTRGLLGDGALAQADVARSQDTGAWSASLQYQ